MDILERLRRGHAACMATDDGFWTPLADVFVDAKDEIERLRAENERLTLEKAETAEAIRALFWRELGLPPPPEQPA